MMNDSHVNKTSQKKHTYATQSNARYPNKMYNLSFRVNFVGNRTLKGCKDDKQSGDEWWRPVSTRVKHSTDHPSHETEKVRKELEKAYNRFVEHCYATSDECTINDTNAMFRGHFLLESDVESDVESDCDITHKQNMGQVDIPKRSTRTTQTFHRAK